MKKQLYFVIALFIGTSGPLMAATETPEQEALDALGEILKSRYTKAKGDHFAEVCDDDEAISYSLVNRFIKKGSTLPDRRLIGDILFRRCVGYERMDLVEMLLDAKYLLLPGSCIPDDEVPGINVINYLKEEHSNLALKIDRAIAHYPEYRRNSLYKPTPPPGKPKKKSAAPPPTTTHRVKPTPPPGKPPRKSVSPPPTLVEESEISKLIRAAQGGSPDAQMDLGLAYKYGSGIEQNSDNAFAWMIKAANSGLPDAQLFVGQMFERGEGTTQSDADAFNWYQKAALNGERVAQYNLGIMYDVGIEGTPPNPEMSAHWHTQAAGNGYTKSKFFLGRAYLSGDGVPKNAAQAAKLLLEGANEGDEHAQCSIGKLYILGEEVRKDYTLGIFWLEKSAEQGKVEAQFILGIEYMNGESMSKDMTKAKYWLEKAAEQRDDDAQFLLGKIYLTTDTTKGYAFIRRAAEQGNDEAIAFLDSNSKAPGTSPTMPSYPYGTPPGMHPVSGMMPHSMMMPRPMMMPHPMMGTPGPFFGAPAVGYGMMPRPMMGFAPPPAMSPISSGYPAPAHSPVAHSPRTTGAGAGSSTPRGDESSDHNLLQGGRLYDLGRYDEAITYIRAAAKAKIPSAMALCGVCSYFGQGTKKDYFKAVEWFQQAADERDTLGMYYLGICYLKGEGLVKSESLGFEWMRRAATAGHEDARKIVDNTKTLKGKVLNWKRFVSTKDIMLVVAKKVAKIASGGLAPV